MKTQIIKFMALIAFIAGVFSCSDKEEQQLQMTNSEINSESSDNRISSLADDTLMTSFDVDGLVDMTVEVRNINDKETVTAITLKMDEGIDVTSLAPTITLAPGASIIPESGTVQDFSKHVVYAVIAEDGTKSIYLVVSEDEPKTRAPIDAIISATTGGGARADIRTGLGPDSLETYIIAENSSRLLPADDRWSTEFRVNGKQNTHFLEGWYLNNGVYPVSNESRFSYPLTRTNNELQARYALKHRVTVQSEDTNMGTVSGGGLANDFGDVTIIATAKTDYRFEGWYKNGSRQSYPATHTFRPTEDFALIAKFTPPVTISGVSSICYGSIHTLNVSNAPSGITWSKSNNLINISNATASSAKISAASSSSQGMTIVSVKSNGMTLATYEVWVGHPGTVHTLYCEGSWPEYNGVMTLWDIACDADFSGAEWVALGYDDYGNRVGGTVEYYSYTGRNGHAHILFTPGVYTVSVRASNSCGFTPYTTVYGFVVYDYSLSFNPQTDEIEISVAGLEAAKKAGITPLPQFTISVLDNNKASRKQSNFTGKNFATSARGFADGTYTIAISDGKTTQTQELVIKR